MFEPTSPEQAQENLDMFYGMALGGLILVFWIYLYYKVKLLLRK
jgi:hypothetical protein